MLDGIPSEQRERLQLQGAKRGKKVRTTISNELAYIFKKLSEFASCLSLWIMGGGIPKKGVVSF